MDFISNLIKRPISIVLSDTGATSAAPTTTEKSPTKKLQLQDDKQHGTIEQNQSSPSSQMLHSKYNRNALINDNESTGQPLIETADPWKLLPLPSSPSSVLHHSPLSTNYGALTNSIDSTMSLPINSNNVHGTIEQNQSSSSSQMLHSKYNRNALINDNELIGQPLIETADPWKLLPLPSSPSSVLHHSPLSTNDSTLSNSIGRAMSLPINSNNVHGTIEQNQSSPSLQMVHSKCNRNALINDDELIGQPLIETADPWKLLPLPSSPPSILHQSPLSTNDSTLSNSIGGAMSLPINSNNVHGTIEQNQSSPSSQMVHSKCKRNALLNDDELIGQPLIETADPWKLLPLPSSPPSILHQSPLSTNNSTLTNSIGNATSLSINSNNVLNLSDNFVELNNNDKRHTLTPLKVGLKSPTSTSLIQTPIGSPTTPPLSKRTPPSSSTRNLSPSETIEQLLFEINDNIDHAVGASPTGGVTLSDVLNSNGLVRSHNQQRSPLMATKGISPLINTKSVTAVTGTTIATTPLPTPTDDSSGTMLKPANKMSRSFDITTTITPTRATPITSNTIVDISVKNKTGMSSSNAVQQSSNQDNHCHGDCDIMLNGHNRTTPTNRKELNNLNSPTDMHKVIDNKLNVVTKANEMSSIKNGIDDNQNNIEEKIQINFEECIIPGMHLNIEPIEGTSTPLSASSARDKYHLIVPSESDTAPSSDNELYTDCTDGEFVEKDPLSTTNPTEDPLNDTNTDLDSYCSAMNEVIRNNDDEDVEQDNNVLDNTTDSINDITMDAADHSNQNNITLQVANNKNTNQINNSDAEPMDVDTNVTLNDSNTSIKTIAPLTIEIENVPENEIRHLKEGDTKDYHSQIETNVGRECITEENASNIVEMSHEQPQSQQQKQQQITCGTVMNAKEEEIVEERKHFTPETTNTDSSINLPLNDNSRTLIPVINVNVVTPGKCSSPTLDQINVIQEGHPKETKNDEEDQANDKEINQKCSSDCQTASISANGLKDLKSENKRRTFTVPQPATVSPTATNDEADNLNTMLLIRSAEENDNVNDEINETIKEHQSSHRRTFNMLQEVNDNRKIEEQQPQRQETINMNNSCEPMDVDDDISLSSSPRSSTSNVNEVLDDRKISLKFESQQISYTSDNNVKSAELDDNSTTARGTEFVVNDNANTQDNKDEPASSIRSIQKRPSIRDYKKLPSIEAKLLTKKLNTTMIQDTDKYDDKNQMYNNERRPSVADDPFKRSNNNNFDVLSTAIKSSDQQQEQSAGCNDQQFEQQFNNNNIILQPNDFDYLLSKGNNNVPVIVDRSSLLLKFDPLIGAPVPVVAANQHHNTTAFGLQQQQQLLLQLPVSNGNSNNNNKLLSPTREEHEEEEVEEEEEKPRDQEQKQEEKAKSREEKEEKQSLEIVKKGKEIKEQQEGKEKNQEKETCEEARNYQNTVKVAQQNPINNESHNELKIVETKQHRTQVENSMQDTQTSANFASSEPAKKSLIKSKSKQQQQELIDLTDKEKKRHAIMSVDVDVIKDMNLDNDCNKAYENSNSIQSEDKQQSNYKMDELEKKIKNEVLKTEDIEKKLKDAEQREEALIKRITEKDRTISKMNGVIEAYEKAIAEFIAEKEQLMQNYEKQLAEVKADRDSNYHHLTSLETTFSDLHVKYEKSKEMTSQLKANEEVVLAEKRQYMENLRLQEQRYEKMKSHAMQQLEIANKKLETLGREHAMETTKLKALLKKEEIARISINEQLVQKTKENMELMKICDELIQGQES